MARQLRVVGLMNIQFAIKKEDGRQVLYVLEVNPRASRTVPFVAKATGMPVAKRGDESDGRRVAGRAGLSRRSDSRRSCRSRRACFRSRSSPASTSCSGRRCVRPAR